MKGDELVKYRFEDAKTLYECFQRGKRESSKLTRASVASTHKLTIMIVIVIM